VFGDTLQDQEGIAYAECDLQRCIEPKQFHGSDASTATGRVRVATMEGIGAFFPAERFTELARGVRV
jgi:hypothetical protein